MFLIVSASDRCRYMILVKSLYPHWNWELDSHQKKIWNKDRNINPFGFIALVCFGEKDELQMWTALPFECNLQCCNVPKEKRDIK